MQFFNSIDPSTESPVDLWFLLFEKKKILFLFIYFRFCVTPDKFIIK